MRCPWPAIRLARALRDAVGVIEILADDPAAPKELSAVAKSFGARLEPISADDATIFRITPAIAVNAKFTHSD